MVKEFEGAGTFDEVRGVEVRGEDGVGRDGVEDGVEYPGSVVIATVPGVVRSQPPTAPTTTNAAAATRTRVLILATIGVRPSYGGSMPVPADELDGADAALAVLHQVLTTLGPDDSGKQTACREFDVAALTDHLMNSITLIGGAAGAEFPARDVDASVEDQVMAAAKPALAAWRERGLDGTVSTGAGEAPAKMMAGILTFELLVHAWDYAVATGGEVRAADELSEYVLGLCERIITPEGRATVGFDPAIELPGGACALDRLLAFTGRAR